MVIGIDENRLIVFTYAEIRRDCRELYDTITEDMTEAPPDNQRYPMTVREAAYWGLVEHLNVPVSNIRSTANI